MNKGKVLNTIRWILVFPLSILGGGLCSFLMNIINVGDIMPAISSVMFFYLGLFYIASKIAPNFEDETAAICGIIYAAISLFIFAITLAKTGFDFTILQHILGNLLGGGWAIKTLVKQESIF